MYHITKPYSPLCHHLIKEIENVPQNLLLHRQSSEQAEDFFLVIQQAFADVVAHTHILLFLFYILPFGLHPRHQLPIRTHIRSIGICN